LLVSWCVVDSCDVVDSDDDLGRSRILVQRTEDGQAQVRYSVVRRSGGWVIPCVVSDLGLKITVKPRLIVW
jgi:hypothetical protein